MDSQRAGQGQRKQAGRSRIIRVRVTPEEYDRLRCEADLPGETQSRIIRRRVFEEPSPAEMSPLTHPEVLQALTGLTDTMNRVRWEISRIGTNINQIAKRVNTSGGVSDYMLKSMKSDLLMIEQQLERVERQGVAMTEGQG